MFRSVYNFIIYPSSVSLLLTCSANSVLFWYSIYKMKVSQIHVRVTTFPSNIGSLLPFPHCKCCLYCNLTLIPKGMRAYPCANIGYRLIIMVKGNLNRFASQNNFSAIRAREYGLEIIKLDRHLKSCWNQACCVFNSQSSGSLPAKQSSRFYCFRDEKRATQ